MNRGPVFLSAGVPSKNVERYQPDPVAVREAVRALVAVTVTGHDLVFGGHPAISPLIWEAAASLNAVERVVIYQSEWFRNFVPKEVRYFKQLVWTPLSNQAPGDLQENLLVMREWMIKDRRIDGGLQFAPFDVAFFIGGEVGVEDEWNMFVTDYKNAPAYPVGSTEGAARRMLDDPNRSGRLSANDRGALANDLNYRELFRRLLP